MGTWHTLDGYRQREGGAKGTWKKALPRSIADRSGGRKALDAGRWRSYLRHRRVIMGVGAGCPLEKARGRLRGSHAPTAAVPPLDFVTNCLAKVSVEESATTAFLPFNFNNSKSHECSLQSSVKQGQKDIADWRREDQLFPAHELSHGPCGQWGFYLLRCCCCSWFLMIILILSSRYRKISKPATPTSWHFRECIEFLHT